MNNTASRPPAASARHLLLAGQAALQRPRVAAAILAAALLGVTGLAFGVFAARLGFYWDDWMLAYFIRFLGPGSFPEAYAIDRPLLAYVYTLTAGLLGVSPAAWQVFALLMRWLTGLALAWMLLGVWPQRRFAAAALAFLFIVYPGFRSHNIAITYGNAFVLYALFFLSFGLTFHALRRPPRFRLLYAASILTGALSIFLSEYFFGLELLRPVLIGLILGETLPASTRPSARLKRTLTLTAPFLLLMALFALYRLANPSARGQITLFSDLAAAPLGAVLDLARSVAADLLRVTLQAWAQVFDFAAFQGYDRAVWVNAGLIGLAAAALNAVALWLTGRVGNPTDRRRWGLTAVVLGLLALLLAGLPFWASSLQMSLSFPRDRFTAGMMLGAALLLLGLLELPAPSRGVVIGLTALAVGLAAVSHYGAALSFRKEWLAQGDFFWQLAWRAPGLQPGTVLMVTETPFPYDSDHSLTAPLNWIYAPQNNSRLGERSLPYLYYNIESHLSRGKPPLAEDLPLRVEQRLVAYDGSLAQALLVVYQPGACLKVIDPAIDANLPDKPRYFREALPLSDPRWIDPAPAIPARPPQAIFGAEPAHGWCYYYQKATLAIQTGDWQAAASYADAALADPASTTSALADAPRLYRRNVAEMVPFIQAYVRTGQWDKAVAHTLAAHRAWENVRPMLCAAWQPGRDAPAFAQVQPALGCP